MDIYVETMSRHSILRLILVLGSLTTILTVPSPPMIVKQPPSDSTLFQVASGADEKEKPFILECEATGEPQPTYKWTKSGRPFDWQVYDDRISQQPGRGTLVFTSPSDVDEGYYQCMTTNEHGTALSNAVFVRKSELSFFPDEPIIQKVVNEGEPLTLPCSPPTGFPKPNIFWIIQSHSGTLRSINSSRITVDPEGRLHFTNVTQADSYPDADYACSASIIFRNEYKLGNKVKLTVLSAGSSSVQKRYPPVEQYLSPPNIVARRGDPLEIHCMYGGTPLPEIRWKKRGAELPMGRHTTINYGKTLKLLKVDLEDEGTYECAASNGVGTAQSYAVTVTVQSVPYWISEPNDTNAAEDEDVEFECKATGVPEPEIRWFVNGIPMDQAKPNPRRKSLSPTAIRIEKLEKSDTAVYQCNASNALGYVFKNFYVNVLALPPDITEQPEKLYEIVDGHSITLTCRVFGAPKPHVTWVHEGKQLTGDRFRTQDNGDLHILNATFHDMGHYQCLATNKLGEVRSPDNHGYLDVKERTRIMAEPEDYEVAAGRSVTFRCNARADSSLDLHIDWLSNGQPIDFEEDPRMFQADDFSLIISKTSELDSGEYTCVARTRLDSIMALATLIVQDVPNPPRVVGVECNPNTASIEWQPMGDNRAPILGYVIQYNTSFTPESWDNAFTFVPASDFKFTVTMSPWANYTFRVIARNKIGPSLPSSHSQLCTTPSDVPHKNPENVIGKGTLPTNLVISWTPMSPMEHNAPNFFYRVYYRRDLPNVQWSTVDIYQWNQSQYEIGEQETFRAYRIKVEAHNSMGQANVAAVDVIGYSGEDVPALPPGNLTLQRMINMNTADISWEHVPPESVRGHFKGYKIQTWTTKEGINQLRQMVVPSNVMRTHIYMLVPYSENHVRVLVFNGASDGPSSNVITFFTPEGVPGPVASFEAVPMGSSALYLIWKKPREPNGVLTGYRIYYEEVTGTSLGPMQERTPNITDPRDTRAKLAGLESGTRYRVTIKAATSVGAGVPYFIELSTRNINFEPPDKPTFTWSLLPTEAGKAGIKVTWLPNVEGRPGTHFYAQYRRKSEMAWGKTAPEESLESITIKGLEPGTVYEIQVVSMDGIFFSSSDPEEIETIGDAEEFTPTPSKVSTR